MVHHAVGRECFPNRALNGAENLRLAPKAHLLLGRMGVHIHHLRRYCDADDGDRAPARRQRVGVALLNGVREVAILHPAGVDD